MKCSHCAGECHCSHGDHASGAPGSERVTVFIDPENDDCSEERFAASVSAEASVDVVMELEAAARADHVERTLARHLGASQPATISGAEPSPPQIGISAEHDGRAVPAWRDEVNERLRGFRQRRRPRAQRRKSLPLEFDRAVAVAAPEAVAAPALPLQVEEVTAPAAPFLPQYLPTAGEVLEISMDAYGLIRWWPLAAPRNPMPFWRKQELKTTERAAAMVVSETPLPANEVSEGSNSPDCGGSGFGPPEMFSSFEPSPAEDYAATSNIIEFPSTVEPVNEEIMPHELAEPVISTPRIFEAEEVSQLERYQEELARIVAREPMPMMTFESPDEEALPRSASEFELPLAVAPLQSRALATGVDAAVVTVAALCFGMVVNAAGALIYGKAGYALLAMAGMASWALYQYLFYSRVGVTPGMRLMNLQVKRIDDKPLTRHLLSARALSVALSTAALGMGFWWALVDEDRLTWHDRITGSFVGD